MAHRRLLQWKREAKFQTAALLYQMDFEAKMQGIVFQAMSMGKQEWGTGIMQSRRQAMLSQMQDSLCRAVQAYSFDGDDDDKHDHHYHYQRTWQDNR